jgi:hypothetical protein
MATTPRSLPLTRRRAEENQQSGETTQGPAGHTASGIASTAQVSALVRIPSGGKFAQNSISTCARTVSDGAPGTRPNSQPAL